MDIRNGENEKTWFRSNRFIKTENGWYFVTREDTQEGPFASRIEAERELSYYIRYKNQFEIFNEYALPELESTPSTETKGNTTNR